MKSRSKYAVHLNLSDNWQFLCCFLLSIFIIIGLTAWFLFQSYSRLANTSTLLQAESLTTTLKEVRILYTQEVVSIAKRQGLKITHDYKKYKGAIPLPATLSMILGNRIGLLSDGSKSFLYSAYPFSWREEGGLTDNFKRQAWQALRLQPDQPFYLFEGSGSDRILRYATADVMQQGCVQCHNSHPDTPKSDWQIGDVRGILEVQVPAKSIETLVSDDLYTGIISASVILLIFFSVGYVIFSKLRSHSVELQESNKQLYLLATYDPLTGLYNRRMLIEHVLHAISLAIRHKNRFCLLYFDLDDFKKVNDNCGHSAGDRLLVQVAERIGCLLRDSDTFARMGGDEFVVLVEGVEDSYSLTALARRIIAAFENDFWVGQQSFKVTSSIGIAIYPENGKNPEELIINSDTAMYAAKNTGRNCFKFYSESMNEQARVQLEVERDIKEALKNNEFSVYYQPKVNPIKGVVCGAEALIRWHHPKKGLISPAKFMPIAELSDLIIEIDKWVREQVCRQILSWEEKGFPRLKISVNVSGKEFMRSEVLQHLIDLFEQYAVNQNLMELEITENTLMVNQEQGNTDYRTIRDMGVGLSIDDFGTGYCSLGYLKKYPVDTLKIDKSFIDNIINNERDAAIAKTIISMAHSLDMVVVAEGVETAGQRDFLIAHNCDLIQGYFYSAPMPIQQFDQFVINFDITQFDVKI
ncbi:MAG: EAL domain-containing protein [Pseudomonadales bacterium]|nr:EAL domain-containing protein [Pseudomonadales bacterium]NRA14548.1 EAL domain-containing protein [Oceanospirillaceae bacterium]